MAALTKSTCDERHTIICVIVNDVIYDIIQDIIPCDMISFHDIIMRYHMLYVISHTKSYDIIYEIICYSFMHHV
jgi:hypothetical protein